MSNLKLTTEELDLVSGGGWNLQLYMEGGGSQPASTRPAPTPTSTTSAPTHGWNLTLQKTV